MPVKRLDPSHVNEYRALMLEAFERHPDAFISSHAERAAQPLSAWEARLKPEAQPSDLVLGAFRDSQLAGVVGLHFELREKARHKATLVGMYVPARFRRQGVGRELVRAALSEASARPGVRLVQLMVTHGNRAAQGLYEQCGFVQYGLEPLAVRIGDGFVSKVHMWCDLEKANSSTQSEQD